MKYDCPHCGKSLESLADELARASNQRLTTEARFTDLRCPHCAGPIQSRTYAVEMAFAIVTLVAVVAATVTLHSAGVLAQIWGVVGVVVVSLLAFGWKLGHGLKNAQRFKRRHAI